MVRMKIMMMMMTMMRMRQTEMVSMKMGRVSGFFIIVLADGSELSCPDYL